MVAILDGVARPAAMPVAVAVGVSMLAGCCTSKRCQLESVARDWAYTIRASQVIPVYPLTEDVQPGDVFLVQVPVDKQQEVYRKKGFLPLDNHIDRLHPAGYADFYGHSFFDDDEEGATLPRDWIRPDGDAASWSPAPAASFPSYSFSVKRGSGINAAVPVQGIPLGLSLMGSDSANGSVVIEDARTMGIDTISLYRALQDWARINRDFLANFASQDSAPTSYLRVVTRTYSTGELNVVLNDASSVGGTGDVGAPKQVSLLEAQPPEGTDDTRPVTLQNYSANLKALNEIVRDNLPGASFKFAAASSRSVTLHQTYDPPLVLGYLGFDVAIAPGGLLGPPIPTQAVLDERRYGDNRPSPAPAELVARRRLWSSLYGVLVTRAREDERAARLKERFDSLAELVPEEPVDVYRWNRRSESIETVDLVEEGRIEENADDRTYEHYLVYRRELERARSLLQSKGGDEQALEVIESELRRLEDAEAGARESEYTTAVLLYLLEATRR